MPCTRPLLRKIGTIDIDTVETTPVVWQGRLLRFDCIRTDYWDNHTGRSYYRFVDMENGATTPAFGWDHAFGSAYAEGDTMYVFGTVRGGKPDMDVMWSTDLVHWACQPAVELPRDWGLDNQTVCQGPDRYLMALEVGEPEEMVGRRFTCFFLESADLKSWRLLPPEDHVFARDRYTACPALRWVEPYYYMIYLEMFQVNPAQAYDTLQTSDCYFEPYIVRTRDFVEWESSACNPVLTMSAEDKLLAHPHFTEAQKAHIAGAVNRNNSDVDLCEFQGQTIVLYSWGAQTGTEFLAEAVYDGGMAEFLQAWFE